MPFLLIAALAVAPLHLPVPAPHAVVRARLAACGVSRGRIRVIYEGEAQEEVVRIAAGPTLSRKTMECMAGVSIATLYSIDFDDGQSWRTYNPIDSAREQAAMRREARASLRRQGRLAALPRFDPKRTIASFARRLEDYCGVKPGSVLMEFSPRFLTIRQEPDRARMMVLGDRFECLMQAISASDLERHGVTFGFFGNAAR